MTQHDVTVHRRVWKRPFYPLNRELNGCVMHTDSALRFYCNYPSHLGRPFVFLSYSYTWGGGGGLSGFLVLRNAPIVLSMK